MQNYTQRLTQIKSLLSTDRLFSLKRAMDFASDYIDENDEQKLSIKNTLVELKQKDFSDDELLEILSQIKEPYNKKQNDNELDSKVSSQTLVFEANNITKIYKKAFEFELEPISFELNFNQITSLVGQNASGKTTIMRIVSGELLHNEGATSYPYLKEVLNIEEDSWYEKKKNIFFIPQDLPKWAGKLIDNLYFLLAVRGKKEQEIIDEVDFMLHRLDLEKFKDASWDEISGGYKMRFTLAKALLSQPKLLVLDEPLANLDINTQKLFLQDLKDCRLITYCWLDLSCILLQSVC